MFLTARRLVEAGVRVVTFDWGGWDTHGDNFNQLRKQLPKLDRGVSRAASGTCTSRGMDKDVTVVMWGEFGRTPRVNQVPVAITGRGWRWASWPAAACELGQAIGTTTENAEEAKDRPVHLQEVLPTLYHNLGINVAKHHDLDPNGRPQYLVDKREVISELV